MGTIIRRVTVRGGGTQTEWNVCKFFEKYNDRIQSIQESTNRKTSSILYGKPKREEEIPVKRKTTRKTKYLLQ